MTNLKKIILTIAIILVLTNFISVINAESISIEVFHDHRGDHEFCEIKWNSDEYTSKVREEFKIVDCENFLNNIQPSRGWTQEIEHFVNDFNNFYQCEKSKWENANDLLNDQNVQRIGEATDKYTLTRFCDANQEPNPDTTAPVITNIQTNPLMPFINYGDEQKINIYFDSNEYPIEIKLKLYNENQELINSQGPIEILSPNYFPVNYLVPAQLSDGEYYLYMTAIDNAENSKEYFVGKFKVKSQEPNPDTTAPVITNIQTNPLMPFINYGDEQKINIYFDSNEYPIEIKLKLYNENQELINSQGPIEILSPNYFPVNYLVPAQLSDGEYYLYMTAIDNAENSKEYFVGKFKVKSQEPNPDTTAPVITIISPNKIERTSTILFKIKTNEQSKTWFSLDNENFKMNDVGENTFIYTLKDMKEDEYKIIFYAEDLSGNKANKKLEFEIDFYDQESCSNCNSNNFQTLEFNNNAIQTQPNKIISSSPQESVDLNIIAENPSRINYILWIFIFGILILLILILIVYLLRK